MSFRKGPTPRIHGKKCCICGRRVCSNHSIHCAYCRDLAVRMAAKRLPPETVEDIWAYVRKYGYVCYYTGMLLDMSDPQGPWYGVLDHWIPGDSRKVVLTSALLNEMKSALTEDEFWYFVRQLNNFRVYGTKIRKRMPRFWEQRAAYSFTDMPAQATEIFRQAMGLPVTERAKLVKRLLASLDI